MLIDKHVSACLNPGTRRRVYGISPHSKHVPKTRIPYTSPKEGPKSSVSLMQIKVARSKARAQNCPVHPKAKHQFCKWCPLPQKGTNHSPSQHPKGRDSKHQMILLTRSTCSFVLVLQESQTIPEIPFFLIQQRLGFPHHTFHAFIIKREYVLWSPHKSVRNLIYTDRKARKLSTLESSKNFTSKLHFPTQRPTNQTFLQTHVSSAATSLCHKAHIKFAVQGIKQKRSEGRLLFSPAALKGNSGDERLNSPGTTREV